MKLIIEVGEDLISKMLGLLTPEFMVKVQVGSNLKTVVCDQLGVHDTYFEERVQTLFLNSKPVDDPTTAIIRDGDILALSAAMPGLVGATFRKGGQYSWMRKIISHEAEERQVREVHGWVRLKLFNLVMKELGPGFLINGAWVMGNQVKTFFESQSPEFLGRIQALILDDDHLSMDELCARNLAEERLFLKVSSE